MADYQQKRDFMKKFFKTIIPIIVIAVALILFLNWANKTEKLRMRNRRDTNAGFMLDIKVQLQVPLLTTMR